MNDHWAVWQDDTGAAHCRPLFKDEPRGHEYTGPLKTGETQIEVEEGVYPDKVALSTLEKQTQMGQIKAECEAPPVTRTEFDALKAELAELKATLKI